jgi:peptide/nickel transport system substrate-binding protein
MKIRRREFSAALALAFGGLIAWAAAIGAAETPTRGGTLDFAMSAEPPAYDCHASGTYATVQLLAPHYSTLLKFDLANYPQVTGDLAESWTVSEDGKTFVFTLKPGVTFHDGSPLTSEDVKATYERLRNPPPGVVSVRKASFEDIERIETPDPATIVFRLSDVNAAMLPTFASPWNCVYSARRLAEDPRYPEHTVLGSGAFRFVEHIRGSHWIGARYDGYFVPGLPRLDGFRAVFLLQSAAMLNALEGGQVLAEFRTVAPAERDRLKRALGDRLRVEEESWVNFYLVSFNTERKPFDDARVRRALSLAIDRWGGSRGLSRTSMLQHVGGVMRPGSPFAASEAELAALPGYGKDINAAREEARRLLKEARASNLSFTFTNRTLPNPNAAAGVFLIDQWRQIGVQVEHRQLETAAFSAAQASGGFDVLMDFSNEYVDEPNIGLAKFISFDRSPINSSRAIDRTLDALYDRQRRTIAGDERNAIIRLFERRLLEEAYIVPILWSNRIVATHARLRGWRMSPSQLLGQDLAEVWLAPP